MRAVAQRLDEIPRASLISPAMAAGLAFVDERTLRAGLLGADAAALYRPPER